MEAAYLPGSRPRRLRSIRTVEGDTWTNRARPLTGEGEEGLDGNSRMQTAAPRESDGYQRYVLPMGQVSRKGAVLFEAPLPRSIASRAVDCIAATS